jgi:hypothetical protein
MEYLEIPKSIKDAKRIDATNGNTLWWDSIDHEMKNAGVIHPLRPRGADTCRL